MATTRKKSAAPRRKASPAVAGELAPGREMRGTKLTCAKRVCNTDKWNLLQPLFDRVCSLKNQMSAYVVRNALTVLINPYALKADYKDFHSKDLNAWERQALFHDIVGDYQRSLQQRFKNHPFKLQKHFSTQKYQRALTLKPAGGWPARPVVAGQLKDCSLALSMRTSALTALANYLLRTNIALFDPLTLPDDHPMKADFLRITQDQDKWARLKRVARQRQVRLISRQSTVHYVTGTFRVSPAQSRMTVLMDKTNGEHQLWLQLRTGLGRNSELHHLPLQVNKARLRTIAKGDIANLGLQTEMRLKLVSGRKLHVCTVYDACPLSFLQENHSMGLDLNTKRSFATDDAGASYHLDDVVLASGVALLTKIDKEGGVSKMQHRRSAQLRQWLRRNEAHIKKRLAQWCDEWVASGITDLWLEDLSMSHDTTMIRHAALNEKYSRVLRLMRLSGVKDWLFSIAEKRGVRVHTTNPAYSSQKCPVCHHISRGNRPSQAVFQCEQCKFGGDADQVAAVNLKARGHRALRSLCHIEDAHGRCSPRRMSRSVLKTHLGHLALAGPVTELLGPALTKKSGSH